MGTTKDGASQRSRTTPLGTGAKAAKPTSALTSALVGTSTSALATTSPSALSWEGCLSGPWKRAVNSSSSTLPHANCIWAWSVAQERKHSQSQQRTLVTVVRWEKHLFLRTFGSCGKIGLLLTF